MDLVDASIYIALVTFVGIVVAAVILLIKGKP